jgi:PhzF family phenazine biosynthesis protein
MKVYVVDAFTDKLFSGNPAAVCPLDNWLPDNIMQQIAYENNLAETTFIVKEVDGYRIRWFTPATEVELCGHATLAASHVFFQHLGYHEKEITFNSLSGPFTVTKNANGYTLNFPVDTLIPVQADEQLLACFDITPVEMLKGKTDYMFVYQSQADIEHITISLPAIAQLDARGAIITAPGDEVDMVSRFFAPQSGIDEDPVTGSAHTSLTPYWAGKLGKNKLSALQLSRRGGKLFCELAADRVNISGQAITYMIGDIQLAN